MPCVRDPSVRALELLDPPDQIQTFSLFPSENLIAQIAEGPELIYFRSYQTGVVGHDLTAPMGVN